MQNETQGRFRRLVDEVAQQLVSVEHHVGRSFIRVPLLYPSGANVVVRVEGADDRFFISDAGFGHQEADMMGATLIYARHGKSIAENAGVGFDNQAFFVIEAARDQVAGAVVTIANCSLEAVALAAYKLSERKTVDETEALYERLIRIFPRSDVKKHAEFVGSSTTKWSVATIVKIPSIARQAVFEPVTKHHASVVNAAAKFHDLALLAAPPVRVAVVREKAEFGPWLGLLSHAANVIDANVPDTTIARVAEAA